MCWASSIEPYSHEDQHDNSSRNPKVRVLKPSTDEVEQLLLEVAPVTEDEFLHMACGHFGVSASTIKPYYVDAMARGNFEKTRSNPPILKFKHEPEDEPSWESDHGSREEYLEDIGGDPSQGMVTPSQQQEEGNHATQEPDPG